MKIELSCTYISFIFQLIRIIFITCQTPYLYLQLLDETVLLFLSEISSNFENYLAYQLVLQQAYVSPHYTLPARMYLELRFPGKSTERNGG